MNASLLLGLILFASWPTAQAQITLEPGEFYFRVAGRPAFVFGRNPTGTRLEHFEELLRPAAESGEKIVRIQRGSDRTTISLPPFEDAIALKATASVRTAPASR